MLTWKTCAKLSIMTPQEREAFFASEPPKPSLLRLVLQDYTRGHTLGRYPAVNDTVITDIEKASNTHLIEYAALLKAALQRHILDAFKGKYLLEAGISPMEARIHPDASVYGLKMPESTIWKKMAEELYKERPWPWDSMANQAIPSEGAYPASEQHQVRARIRTH